MWIERGVMGALPWAAIGSGRPVVVLAGLTTATGVKRDGFVRAVLTPVRQLADRRRLFALNRRAGLPADLTMSGVANEHAAAFRSYFGEPIDLVGVSTGGSIAQQVAAEHPDVVRRLVLISTACRLGLVARASQAAVAEELRSGRTRQATATAVAAIAPWAGPLARGAGWVGARRVLPTPTAAADLLATLDAEDRFDLALCAGQIDAQTLIIGGGRDRFYTADLFRETADLIPASQLSIFPRRGHIGVARDRHAVAQIAGFVTWEPSVIDETSTD